MMANILDPIRTIELAAWDFDDYKFRPAMVDGERPARAREFVARRKHDCSSAALCEEETQLLREALDLQRSRPDLQREMCGLDWFLGVVDLRRLLAFQRRLSFTATLPSVIVPSRYDWDSLIAIAFASAKPVSADMVYDPLKKALTLRSTNPNLRLRVTHDPAAPVALHAGSPFFEVAQYAGRWFLRDGYHRAYRLLRAGIFQFPAVIVRARTLEELGAVGPQFFPEAILLSECPPLVGDFLDHNFTIDYECPPIIKTLRITMEENIVSSHAVAVSGEKS